MEEKITFGKFISRKRKELNLTQKELADRLYVTESAVSKWERGLSYPDITLVSTLCKQLQISEHELITSSEDYHQREIENQAQTLVKVKKTYNWIWYVIYGITLATCFICNLAISHNLSWFFIVLTSIMTAFSLTSVPVIVKKNKGLWTLIAFFASLNILLLTCNIYTGGDWFAVAFVAISMSFSIIFTPIIIHNLDFPATVKKHNALISFALDTVLIFALILTVNIYYSYENMGIGVLIALVSLALPWAIMLIIRYLPINGLFKTSLSLFLSAIFMFLINPTINYIYGDPFKIEPYNLKLWTDNYINGNTTVVISLSCLLVAVVFAICGAIVAVKKTSKNT